MVTISVESSVTTAGSGGGNGGGGVTSSSWSSRFVNLPVVKALAVTVNRENFHQR